MLNICVCVKQVPDPNAANRIDPATKRLVRDGSPLILDPSDESGVEEALRLVEKHTGTVTVVSMGPPKAEEAIRKALAMGADRGILISDPALAGSDTRATARALAAALRNEQFDIIICSTESTDSYTGLVPGQLAQFLGWPQVTFAKTVEIGDKQVTIHRQTDYGYQVVEAPLPAVVTLASGINEPRYPSLKGIMTSKKKPVAKPDLASLGLSASEVGEAGAQEKVLTIAKPEERKAGQKVVDDGEGARVIADFLQQVKLI